jgi:hypothetical protein
MFSFGYWGCGRATRELVRAFDEAEVARGFAPPLWVDIRLKREVRALGFQGDAFAALLPGRYIWMSELGNANIDAKEREPSIRIRDPKAAAALLELASARPERRVIFFCACEYPAWCHRHTVSKLLLAEARKRKVPVTVVEWPGGEPKKLELKVARSTMAKLLGGRLARLPVPAGLTEAASIPWMSTARLTCGGDEVFASIGPARFGSHGSHLPIFASDASEQVISTEAVGMRAELGFEPLATHGQPRHDSDRARRSDRTETPRESVPTQHQQKSMTGQIGTTAPTIETLVAGEEYTVLSLWPAWAWAVMFAGKDVENRSWHPSRRGRILIHASGHKSSAREEEELRGAISSASGLPRSALPATFERSAILGSVEIADCVENARSRWAEPDQLHWKLRDPRPLASPVRGIHGRLQFWRWTMEQTTGNQSAANAEPTRASRAPAQAQASVEADLAVGAKANLDLDDLTPEAVLAALRKVASSKPANEVDVLRAASRELGSSRLGARVHRALKAHVRTAIARGVLAREGKSLRLATGALADYKLEDLVAAMAAIARKGEVVPRAELAAGVAQRLGFPSEGAEKRLSAALDAAVAAGRFAREGSRMRRTG